MICRINAGKTQGNARECRKMQENAGKRHAILETSEIGGIGTFSLTELASGKSEMRLAGLLSGGRGCVGATACVGCVGWRGCCSG